VEERKSLNSPTALRFTQIPLSVIPRASGESPFHALDILKNARNRYFSHPRRRLSPTKPLGGTVNPEATSLPLPTPQSGNYRRQRARVRDYDKSMIAGRQNLLRAWREWDSAPAATRINAKSVIRRGGATIGGGDQRKAGCGPLANPSCLHGNKNIREKASAKWPSSLYGPHMRHDIIHFSSTYARVYVP